MLVEEQIDPQHLSEQLGQVRAGLGQREEQPEQSTVWGTAQWVSTATNPPCTGKVGAPLVMGILSVEYFGTFFPAPPPSLQSLVPGGVDRFGCTSAATAVLSVSFIS